MQNTLGDLNNHLFAQLERLGDEELVGDKLQEEITRSKSYFRILLHKLYQMDPWC